MARQNENISPFLAKGKLRGKIKTIVVESYINLSFISEKTILVSKFNNKQVQIDDGVKVPLLLLTITNRA